MIVIKEFIQSFIISVISVHSLHYGLNDSQGIYFYNILINLIRKLREKENVFKLGDSNGHVGSNKKEY